MSFDFERNIINLSKALEKEFSIRNNKCKSCNIGVIETTSYFKDVIIILVTPTMRKMHQELKLNIDHLPKIIKFKMETYKIASFISFEVSNPKIKDTVGHFCAYYYNETSQLFTKVGSKVDTIKKNTIQNVQFIIYSRM